MTENQGISDNNTQEDLNLSIFDSNYHLTLINNPKYKKFEELSFNNNFFQNIMNSQPEIQGDFLLWIRDYIKEFHRMSHLNENLKNLLKSSQIITNSFTLEETVNLIRIETCKLMECQLCVLYLFNNKTDEFWYKNLTKNEIIRLPKNSVKISKNINI